MAFENLPTDVDPDFLSGVAKFVASDGERTEGMGKSDYAWVANEIVGLARIPNDDEAARASQEVVAADEADDDALGPDEYTTNIFEREAAAWVAHLLDNQ